MTSPLPAILRVTPWRDELVEGVGVDPRSRYVETFWLPVLGPPTTHLSPVGCWSMAGAERPIRAGIYTRISLDRDGTSLSPDRQREACRDYAERMRWEVVGLYEDPDLSGFKRDVIRPRYNALLADVEAGRLDAVIAARHDRLWRNSTEALRALEVFEANQVTLVLNGQPFDASGMGRAFFQFNAMMSELEARVISERVSDGAFSKARKGGMHGGGHRPYGYTRKGEVVTEEAEQLRLVYEDLKAGLTLHSAAVALNKRGAKTTAPNKKTGEFNQWWPRTLRNVLLGPLVIGKRSYKGHLYDGTWKPIFTEAQQLEIKEILATGYQRAPERLGNQHLLTGIVFCAICEGRLSYGRQTGRNGKVFTKYQCKKQPGSTNCGWLAISEQSLDAFVKESVMDHAKSHREWVPAYAEQSKDRQAELERLIADDQRALKNLVREQFSVLRHPLTTEEYREIADDVEARLTINEQALRRELERQAQVPAPAELPVLDDQPIESQKAFIRQWIEKVVAHPAKVRGGNKFDTSRVEFVWRFADSEFGAG